MNFTRISLALAIAAVASGCSWFTAKDDYKGAASRRAQPLEVPPELSRPQAERYRFVSTSHPGVEYEVTIDGADVTCTCPGFEYRGQCRHARDIKAAIGAGLAVPEGYRRS